VTLAIVLCPNPLSHIPSTSSAIKSFDSQSPGPPASLTEMEETPEKTERYPDSAPGRDIQMK